MKILPVILGIFAVLPVVQGADSYSTIAKNTVTQVFVVGVGMYPPAEAPVAVYKGYSFAIHVGETAVNRQDQVFAQEMVWIGTDAVRLQQLHDAGVDLKTSDEAQNIIGRMYQTRDDMFSDDGPVGNIITDISKNRGYVVTVLGTEELISKSVGTFFEKGAGGRWLQKVLPVGRYAAWVVRNEHSPVRSILGIESWEQMGLQTYKVNNFTRNLLDKMLDYEVKKKMREKIVQFEGAAADAALEDMRKNSPNPVVIQYELGIECDYNPGVYSLLYAASAPAASPPVALAVAAFPIPVAVAQPAPSVYAPPVDDPVYTVINNQQTYIAQQGYRPRGTTSTYSAPPIEHGYNEPDPAAEARAAELHKEMKECGDGIHGWGGTLLPGKTWDNRPTDSLQDESH